MALHANTCELSLDSLKGREFHLYQHNFLSSLQSRHLYLNGAVCNCVCVSLALKESCLSNMIDMLLTSSSWGWNWNWFVNSVIQKIHPVMHLLCLQWHKSEGYKRVMMVSLRLQFLNVSSFFCTPTWIIIKPHLLLHTFFNSRYCSICGSITLSNA